MFLEVGRSPSDARVPTDQFENQSLHASLALHQPEAQHNTNDDLIVDSVFRNKDMRLYVLDADSVNKNVVVGRRSLLSDYGHTQV